MKPVSKFLDLWHLVCLLLVAATLLVYLPVRHHGFVSYDDPVYVTGNRYVQAGLTWSGLQWAFTTGHDGNWFPLTWLSHMLDVQLFGQGPAGPHLVNLLFHLANTLLVFAVLRRLSGALWRSALVAALFALHPLRVESVAWIAERKDVLSAFFFLLTLGAYARYAQQKLLDAHAAALNYGLALVFFALGLMSKPMLVTLPCVLLLLDYWPLRRTEPGASLGGLLLGKMPFFALSVVSCTLTFWVQRTGGAVQSLTSFPVGERVGNALVAYARYLGKTFWPADLATPYPHPGHWPGVQVALAAVLVAGVCLGALWMGRKFRFVAVGWFWFFGMMIPTIGLVQVGDQSMADRYTYLPSIGLFTAVVWGVNEVLARWRLPKAVLGIAAGGVLIACAVTTGNQLRYWRDSESLFRHALALTHGNFLAHNNLGNALVERLQVDEAIVHFNKALEIKPDYANARVNLGNALLAQGKVDDAIAQFQAALRSQPDFVEAHYNLGNVLLQKGKDDEAIVHFQQALKTQPDHVMAHNNLANTLLQKGRLDDAILRYRAAVALRPDFVMARHNLGIALLRRGQMDEAVVHFRKIVALEPGNANVHNNLGWMLHQAGEFEEATVHLRRALEIHPAYAEAHDNLGKTLLQLGQVQGAVEHFRTAVKLQAGDPQNLADLAWVLATWPEAPVRNATEALALAQKSDRLSHGQNPAVLRTLAAAYAEGGLFAEAVETARRALLLAESQSNAALAGELRSELKLYEAGSPFRVGLKSEDPSPKPE